MIKIIDKHLKSIINSPILVYDFRQQVFNDAICFLKEAKKVNPNKKPFTYWKYSTWSIMASAIFMESYVVSHVRTIIDEIDPSLLEQYVDSRLGFSNNIDFIDLTFGSKIKDKSDIGWNKISNTIELRNKIAHFNRIDISNMLTSNQNTENGIEACRILVKKLHNAMDTNYSEFAPWIDKVKCEDYDKQWLPKN